MPGKQGRIYRYRVYFRSPAAAERRAPGGGAGNNEMATAIVITVLVVGGFVAVFFVLDRVLRAVSREVDNRD